MPRAKTILQSNFPYHVTGRCINREWFDLPLEIVWDIFCNELMVADHLFSLRIHSFVLMKNHFHLLVSTPDANISKAMQYFMRESSRRLAKRGKRINQTYGARYFRSVIESHSYFMHAYKYVYANPVQAGIVERAEVYKFSTLHGLLGLGPASIPLVEDTLLFEDIYGTLQWINQKPNLEQWEAVRKALRRTEFKYPKEFLVPGSFSEMRCISKKEPGTNS